MSELTGGLGERMLQDSILRHIDACLNALGWYVATSNHLPVRVVYEPIKWDVPVEPNVIGMINDHTEMEEGELGNSLFIKSTDGIQIELLAENDSLGEELSGDLEALFCGWLDFHPFATVPVYDFNMATPVVSTYAVIDSVKTNKIPTTVGHRAWLEHWFAITFDVTRYYSPTVSDLPDFLLTTDDGGPLLTDDGDFLIGVSV